MKDGQEKGYSDLVNIGRGDAEANSIWLVLNTDKPSPSRDINTAALNENRSLFIEALVKSYF